MSGKLQVKLGYQVTAGDCEAAEEFLASLKQAKLRVTLVRLTGRFPQIPVHRLRLMRTEFRLTGKVSPPAAAEVGLTGTTESEKLWIGLRISALKLSRYIREDALLLERANAFEGRVERARSWEWAERQPLRVNE